MLEWAITRRTLLFIETEAHVCSAYVEGYEVALFFSLKLVRDEVFVSRAEAIVALFFSLKPTYFC